MSFSNDPETKCGYKWINLNWLFPKAKDICAWHDQATEEGSRTQEVVSNDRVAEHFGDMLKERAKEDKSLTESIIARLASSFMKTYQWLWWDNIKTRFSNKKVKDPEP